ncbi:MAG: sulfatase [Candidatus Hydrogenedentes bacterium]|nr:sulfatase [Candidatus Hydrogenedentota bacterium]
MNRRKFIAMATGGLAVTFSDPAAAFSKIGGRPNIFIYIADDQYRSSVGCYGAKPSHTPNIDRLAREGVRFTNAFTPSSICTPNRGALLSGMYPLRNGAHPNHSGFKNGVKSLPNYMKELGYRACLAGKDGIQRDSDLYKWEFKIEKTEEHVPGATEPKHDRHRKSDLVAIEKFMADKSDPRPFCFVHAASLPHSPYLNKLPNGLVGYDASNWYMDYEFGLMLDVLERHGLADNTLVIYVNDNEAGQPRTKYTLYDTGLHVPMVARWPGHIRPGSVSNAYVSFLDIMPTLFEVTGKKPPAVMDGMSLVNVMEGRTDHLHDELYFSYTGVIVSSDRLEIPYPIRAVRTARYKYIRNINYTIPHPKQQKNGDDGMRPYEELYDIVADPNEMNNLADNQKFASIKKELSDKIDVWMKHCGDKGIESELQALKDFPPKKK